MNKSKLFVNFCGLTCAIPLPIFLISGIIYGFTLTPEFGYIALITGIFFGVVIGISLYVDSKYPDIFKLKCNTCGKDIIKSDISKLECNDCFDLGIKDFNEWRVKRLTQQKQDSAK